ncbi:type III-B CRISPR module RAMP protein Cmr4 [Candidatus Harpocratesius sp.]
MNDEKIPNIQKIFGKALDPVHIGAGAYKLARVDNAIVRDPTTEVPKIPGTTIAGVFREYYKQFLEESTNQENQHLSIDEIFGTDKFKGKMRFYDGEIIFFPVSSISGIVWLSTKSLLQYWFKKVNSSESQDAETIITLPTEINDNFIYPLIGLDNLQSLNLGWLLLECKKLENYNNEKVLIPEILIQYLKKIVIVSEKLFSHIINDNLEVRTSVSIDSATGAAKDGALFTYEAIPRGTIFGFEIGYDKMLNISNETKSQIDWIINAVRPYIKILGVGGMGTRGFGRINILKYE